MNNEVTIKLCLEDFSKEMHKLFDAMREISASGLRIRQCLDSETLSIEEKLCRVRIYNDHVLHSIQAIAEIDKEILEEANKCAIES